MTIQETLPVTSETTASEPYRTRVLRWILDLESGDYQQLTEGFRKKDKFCCLAVATERFGRDTGRLRWKGDVPEIDGRLYDNAFLPGPVSEYYGIASINPRFDGASAIERNDDRKESFPEIAAAMRREYGF